VLRVLSLGAGVQSTTLLLMSLAGELEPLDLVIFADTGWEPAAIYEHLERLEERCRESDVPLHRVSVGNLRADTIASAGGAERRTASLPFHLKTLGDQSGMLRRQCTKEYKITPIRALVRRTLKARGLKSAELWLGISLDEVQRMKASNVRYATHRWPLIEQRMTRESCKRWLQAHGEAIPPKSACIGCPFKGDRQWRALRDGNPSEWADAVAFDAAIRSLPRVDGEVFLHRQLVPLDQVDLRTAQDKGQLDLWGEECSGVCGV
jgi:hypothetical protein